MRREDGFTLVESLVALTIFLFGLALAAQLLMETSRRMRDVYAGELETPLVSVRARLRADLEAARAGRCVRDPDGTAIGLRALGHPTGTVVYHLENRVLWRFLEEAGPTARSRVLAGVTAFACADAGALMGLELRGRRRALGRTPLVTGPEGAQPAFETWVETLWVAPRGAGRAVGW